MTETSEQNNKRYPGIALIGRYRTALMGAAALWVYYFHVLPVGLLEGTFLQETEWFFHRIGFCGVDMFFLLSAYGLYHRFSAGPVKSPGAYVRYLARRFLRIYPAIVPVALLIALTDNLPLRSLLPRLTFYESFAVNLYRFLWFVPCILVLYLLAPFYDKLFRRRLAGTDANGMAGIRVTAIAVLIALFLAFVGRSVVRPDLYALITRIPVFLIGYCLGYLSGIRGENVPPKKGAGVLLLMVLTLGNVLSYLLHRGMIPEFLPAANALCNVLIAPPLICFLTLAFARCERTRFSAVPIRIFAFFGTVSLEFYALQEWVWGKVETLRYNPVRMHALCLLIVVTGAYGLHALGDLFRGERSDQERENQK